MAMREAEVCSKMRVAPSQLADYRALVGDQSDCIPGKHEFAHPCKGVRVVDGVGSWVPVVLNACTKQSQLSPCTLHMMLLLCYERRRRGLD
jgi:hypothetical protein